MVQGIQAETQKEPQVKPQRHWGKKVQAVGTAGAKALGQEGANMRKPHEGASVARSRAQPSGGGVG